jgi:hypothetical protein
MPTSSTGELLFYSTPSLQLRNGLQETPGFIDEAVEGMLQDLAEPSLRETVIRNGTVLNALALNHELISRNLLDEFGHSRGTEPFSRQMKMSDLIERESHEKGAGEKLQKAVALWESRGLLSVAELPTDGRPAKVLNLNLVKFADPDAVKAEWKSYWEPIRHQLVNRHITKLFDFYSGEIWIAKIDFKTPLKDSCSLASFRKGEIVPANVCVALQSTGKEPDYSRVERLGGNRIMLTVEHKCERCHHSSTVQTPIAKEAVQSTQKGK